MVRLALISLAIAVGIGIAGFAIFLAGMYNAPHRTPYDEYDHIQQICDEMREKPWKQEIRASCEYLQEFWAIDYKCEEIRGCYPLARSDYGENSDQR